MLTNISGFPEFLPNEQIAFNRVMATIRTIFESHGFSPLDTPAVEKVSTLLSKGNDHEIYGIHRLSGEGDNAKKDLALRFDLTVPLARFVGQNFGHLNFPYRRYHMAPVWRGERPQAGRYRQFYQCDVDIIGDGELSIPHDAEVVAIIYKCLKAIGLERFVIKINNRKILTGLLTSYGIDDDHIPGVLRTIDKIHKMSRDDFMAELASHGFSKDNLQNLENLLFVNRTNDEWIAFLNDHAQTDESRDGLEELSSVLEDLKIYGVGAPFIQIDPSLARGLAYYTGTVCETQLLDFPELGSVCGGGRYGNLAGNFSKKHLPGVGVSIGISRLVPKLIESGILKADIETPAQIMVTTQNKSHMAKYVDISEKLRGAGFFVETYFQDKSLPAQIKYAVKRGVPHIIIANNEEFETNTIIVKDLKNSTQNTIKMDNMCDYFNAIL